jgi:hypothetical protein
MEASRVRIDREAERIVYELCDEAKQAAAQVSAAPTHERLLEVESWGGGPLVATSSMWNLVRDWLYESARALAVVRPELELVNATEGGSRIPGFAEIPLADILSRFEELNITPESMLERAAAVREPIDGAKLRDWAQRHVDRTNEAGEAARELAERVRDTQAAVKKGNPKAVARMNERMAAAEARLRDATAAQPLLNAWCCAAIDAVMKAGAQATDSTAMSGAARLALHTEALIAEVVDRGAREMEPRLLAVGSDS